MSNAKNKRPILITLLCILGFIGAIMGVLSPLFIYILSIEILALIPIWYTISIVVLSVVDLIALTYIWKMKKIGSIVYITTEIIGYILALSIGVANLGNLIPSIIVIAILVSYYKKMS